MAKFMFGVATNIYKSDVEEEFEIPDEDLEDLNESARKAVIREYFSDWMWDQIETWQQPVEETPK